MSSHRTYRQRAESLSGHADALDSHPLIETESSPTILLGPESRSTNRETCLRRLKHNFIRSEHLYCSGVPGHRARASLSEFDLQIPSNETCVKQSILRPPRHRGRSTARTLMTCHARFIELPASTKKYVPFILQTLLHYSTLPLTSMRSLSTILGEG